jgi:hypothetical protein
VTNLEAEALKIIRSDLVTAEGHLYDHVATTFRWIMATLFAANGSAILALLASQIAVASTAEAIHFFAAGLLFSILVGVLSAIWGLRTSIRLARIRGKVDNSLLEAVTNPEIVPDLIKEKPNWKTFFPSYAAGVAFVCLILGVLTIASHLEDEGSATDCASRCSGAQH